MQRLWAESEKVIDYENCSRCIIRTGPVGFHAIYVDKATLLFVIVFDWWDRAACLAVSLLRHIFGFSLAVLLGPYKDEK